MHKRDILTADDLMTFLGVTGVSTGQAEYYNTREEQREALVNVHLPVMQADRIFYALMLTSDANELNKMMMAANLLKSRERSGNPLARFENELIVHAANSWEPKYRVRMLEMAMKNKVKLSSRTGKWLVRKVLNGIFSADKLVLINRRRLRRLLVSSHVRAPGAETHDFIFGNRKEFNSEVFSAHARASADPEAVFALPFSVAEGFRAKHGIKKDEFLRRFGRSGKMSEKEKRRSQSRAKKEKIEVAFSLEKAGLFELLKFVRSQKTADLPENWRWLVEEAAIRASRKIAPLEGKTVFILDNSGSGYGSREKLFHPLLLNIAAAMALQRACPESLVLFTNEKKGNLVEEVWGDEYGETNLATPFVKALQQKPARIVILSDGYENAPTGAFSQVYQAAKKKGWLEGVEVLHLSPVIAAEEKDVRRLHEELPTAAFRSEHLGMPLMLLRAQADPVGFLSYYREVLMNRLPEEIRQRLLAMVQAAAV